MPPLNRRSPVERAERRPAPLMRTRPIVVTPSLVERFWAKVDRSGGSEACWLWQGARNRGGYGELHQGGARPEIRKAHRVSWAINCEADPDDMVVCHRCDVPACVNPEHLFLGTIQDNARDMIAKGRGALPVRLPGAPATVIGEAVNTAKLTAEEVREIRRRAGAGENSTILAAAFGVDSSNVRQIVRRVIWRHV